jgi:tetratricopeptide (TPR) repeat protein
VDRGPDYRDLFDRGEYGKILEQTRQRLESHPNDLDALYFRARTLQASGLPKSARPFIERFGKLDPLLAQPAADWLARIDESGADEV